MRFDEIPVDGFAKEIVDMPIGCAFVRAKEDQVFPITNARHEVNPQQIGQRKNNGGLTLRVGVVNIGLYIGLVVEQ